MTFPAVPWLVASSLRASVVVLLVLCFRSTLRRWIGSRAVAWLSLAIVVRLLFPLPATAPWHVPALLAVPGSPAAAAPSIFRVSVSAADTSVEPRAALPHDHSPLPPAAPAPSAFFLLWLAGASLAAARLGRGWWTTRRWAAHTFPADVHPGLTSIYRALPTSLRRGVALRLTDALDVPTLVGVLRPQIWLPRTLPDTLTPAELRHVLLHELGHAHRRDLLAQWLCELACCLHWFNPLVWLLARAARTDRELACDAWVLSRDFMKAETPASYGHTLLKVVEGMRHGVVHTLPVVPMAAGKRRLGLRVREIRAFRPVAPWRGVAALAVTTALVVACTLGSAAAVADAGVVASGAPVPPTSPSPAPAASNASPAPGASAPPASAPAGRPRQVEIESKFIDVTKSAALQLKKSAPPSSPLVGVYHQLFARFAEGGSPTAPTIFRSALVLPDDFQMLVRQLNQAKGVDLLSAPRVTTKSGQKATIEIIREFTYPTAFQRDQGSSDAPVTTPTSFDKKNTGVTLEVTPTIESKGDIIDLSLTWTITNLDGFVDADGKPIPADTEGAKMRFPVFDTRSVSSVATLSSGATVVFSRDEEHLFLRKSLRSAMGGAKREVSPAEDDDRLILVFVTATLVDPLPGAPVGTDGADEAGRTAYGKIPDAEEGKDKAVIERKLDLVIPQAAFHAERLGDALEYLRAEARGLDTAEKDPENRGINIFLKLPATVVAAPASAPATATTEPPAKVDPAAGTGNTPATSPDGRADPRVTLEMNQRPLREVLGALAVQAGMRVKVDRYAVSLVPLTEATERLITAQFAVAPAVLGAPSAPSPADAIKGDAPESRFDPRPWLKQKGVTFPVGSSATYLPASQKLVVRSTRENIERLKTLFPPENPASQGGLIKEN